MWESSLFEIQIRFRPCRSSRSAKRLEHPLVWFGRFGVGGECRLVFVGLRQHGQKLLERGEVVVGDSGLNDGFDAVVSRNEGGIERAHRSAPLGRRLRLLARALPPAD